MSQIVTNQGEQARLLQALEARRAEAKRVGQIDNASLRAGEDMYFYCDHCGLQSDRVPEEYVPRAGYPRKVCQPCEELAAAGYSFETGAFAAA